MSDGDPRNDRGTQSKPGAESKLSGASILVVDDEPGMRNFLAKTLGPRVARLDEAASPAEASRKLDESAFRPDNPRQYHAQAAKPGSTG